MKKYLNKKRVEILDFMEGKCIFCGFSDYRALQVDHINGCGKKNRLDRYALFVDIKKNTHKYQLLCANCNWIKRYEKGEDRGRIYESEVI